MAGSGWSIGKRNPPECHSRIRCLQMSSSLFDGRWASCREQSSDEHGRELDAVSVQCSGTFRGRLWRRAAPEIRRIRSTESRRAGCGSQEGRTMNEREQGQFHKHTLDGAGRKPKQDVNIAGGMVHAHVRDPLLATLPKEALEALARSYLHLRYFRCFSGRVWPTSAFLRSHRCGTDGEGTRTTCRSTFNRES